MAAFSHKRSSLAPLTHLSSQKHITYTGMQVITAWTSMRQSLPLQIVTAALPIFPSRTGNQIATPALLQFAPLMNRWLFGVAEQLESSECARGHGFGGLLASE